MNKLTIIGNLTADPELRVAPNGKDVCNFRIAVNKRKTANNPDPGADYFRVTTWGERATVCKKYLSKGRKVAVIGPVSLSTYQRQDGTSGANLEVLADEVEFLSSARESNVDAQSGMQKVQEQMPWDELPV